MLDSRFGIAAGVLMVVTVAACGGTHAVPPVKNENPPAAAPFQKLVIATLPFDNTTTNAGVPELIRQRVIDQLPSKGYLVRSGPELEDDLHAMGITAGAQVKQTAPLDFRSRLRVDAVLIGTVSKASSIVTGIYNRRALEAELTLIDVRTGAKIWTWHDKIVGSENGIGNIWDLGQTFAQGVKRRNFELEATELAKTATEAMPFCPREGEADWGGQPLPK